VSKAAVAKIERKPAASDLGHLRAETRAWVEAVEAGWALDERYAEGYAIAERARSLRIVVEETNRQARSFYRRSGFVPIEPELFELILPSAD